MYVIYDHITLILHEYFAAVQVRLRQHSNLLIKYLSSSSGLICTLH